MLENSEEKSDLAGLTSDQIPALQKKFGKNSFTRSRQSGSLRILQGVLKEPMLLLLITACSLYFILGNFEEGIMMAVAIVFIVLIDIYQEVRSSRALEALKQFTEPKVTVVRDARQQIILKEELVPGDILLLEEGMRIPADAIVVQAHDCTVDESVITGESFAVEKTTSPDKFKIFQGTTVNSGSCIAKVISTGNHTVLAGIGISVDEQIGSKTLLQKQISRFVRNLALFGLIAFLVILAVNYLKYDEFITSLLLALTLAMAVLPEEIPVAFSSFMALGAQKLSKSGVICRQPQVIENLSAMSVLCLDKTGTITENKMTVRQVYDFNSNKVVDKDSVSARNVLYYATLASESNPFDAMEKAIRDAYVSVNGIDSVSIKMIHEYPLEGKPPMMTHAYTERDHFIVASKGAPERILGVSNLKDSDYKKIIDYVRELAASGYRVIGVASSQHAAEPWPSRQDDFKWQFEGLLALYDPPKSNIKAVLKEISDGKVEIKMLTGDYPETAVHIASEVGIKNPLNYYTGDNVMEMGLSTLKEAVKASNVFARMFPEAKLRVINAIKENGQIVAMTGDGVNDGPALKSADIGIAMGKKGTEIARQASGLVLTDDDLEKVVLALKEGRRIYFNLVKAIRYIIAIHIPIILTAALPVLLGWKYPNIFTPVHVIFLELIMGPTCSIFFEKEPVESSSIMKGPRDRKKRLFTSEELLISIIQGLAISTGVLLVYYGFMNNEYSIEKTRSMVFITLIISNVFLTFVNRSFVDTIFHTIHYKNKLVLAILIVPAAFLAALQFSSYLMGLFHLAPLNLVDLGLCLAIAFVSVIWFEFYKKAMNVRKSRAIKNHKYIGT